MRSIPINPIRLASPSIHQAEAILNCTDVGRHGRLSWLAQLNTTSVHIIMLILIVILRSVRLINVIRHKCSKEMMGPKTIKL